MLVNKYSGSKKPVSKSLTGFCGDGGSRTRVQTSSNSAFYKLSFLLIVGNRQGENRPT